MGMSSHPPALDGSNIIAKMQRLLAWQSNPDQRDRDLDTWRKKAAEASEQYHRFEEEQQEWYDAFEGCRKIFSALLRNIQSQNRAYAVECQRLYRLCEEECLKHGSGSQAVSSEDNAPSNSQENKPIITKTKVSIREMVDELARRQVEFATSRREEEKSLTKANQNHLTVVHIDEESMEAAAKSAVGVNPFAPLVKPTVKTSTMKTSGGIVVKQESDKMDVDDVDWTDADAVYHDARSLQIAMQQLRESMERCEMLESDVDIFFQERDDQLTLLEHVLLQRATGVPMEKRLAGNCNDGHGVNAVADRLLADKTLEELLHLPPRHWDAFLCDALEALEPTGLMTRKKKKTADHINMNVFVRHRSERGKMLVYTPLSQFEDRYLGLFPNDVTTIYAPHRTGRQPDAIVNIRDQLVPSELAALENDALERAYLQSDAAALALHIKQLKQSIADVQKLQQEADVALHKAQISQRHVLLEDQAEYVQTMVQLAEHGVISQEAFATLSSSIDTSQAMAQYEALQQSLGAIAGSSMAMGGDGVVWGPGVATGNSGNGGVNKAAGKGGKQKKGSSTGVGLSGGLGGGVARGASGSAFSALAALTAVTEGAMFLQQQQNQAASAVSATTAATTTITAASSTTAASNTAAAATAAVATTTAKGSKGNRNTSTGSLTVASEESSDAVASPIPATTNAPVATSTAAASRNSKNRKSSGGSAAAEPVPEPAPVASAAPAPAVPAAEPAPSNARNGKARNQRGQAATSEPAMDEPAPEPTPAPATTTASNNKRKSEAISSDNGVTAPAATTSSATEAESSVAAAPAAKRQRVTKK